MFNAKRTIATAALAVTVIAGAVAAPALASDPFQNYMESDQYKIDMNNQRVCNDDKDYYQKWLNEQNMANGSNDVFENYKNSDQYAADMERLANEQQAQEVTYGGPSDVALEYQKECAERGIEQGIDVRKNYENWVDGQKKATETKTEAETSASTDVRENYKNSPEAFADRARKLANAHDDKDFYHLSPEFEQDAANNVR